VEAIFNNHEQVARSALAGVGPPHRQIPVLFIEPGPLAGDKKTLLREIRQLAASNPLTAGIEHVFIEKHFPVDIRHNSKIFREKLAILATRKLGL
ncbi:MAG: peptide synthase, partial [Desulfobacterales bacterium]